MRQTDWNKIKNYINNEFSENEELACELVHDLLRFPRWSDDELQYLVCCSVVVSASGNINNLLDMINVANGDYRDILLVSTRLGIMTDPRRIVEGKNSD